MADHLDDNIDWAVNTIISYPIDGRAMFVANAIQAGTPQSPIPVSPSANKEYQKAHKRIREVVKNLIQVETNKARVEELETINGNLELHVIAWRTLGKAGAVPSWVPKLDEFYVEWSKELANRIAELNSEGSK